MSILETWVKTPAAIALGKTLLHSLWEGAAIALLLALTFCFLRSSRARYAAGCLALIGMLSIFGLTFTRSLARQPMAGAVGPSAGFSSAFEISGEQSPGGQAARPDVSDFMPWVVPFWIAGVLIFHLRCTMTWMAARRLRRTGVCLAPDHWLNRLDGLRERVRVSRPVVLFESCLAEVPVVIGHLRPVILIPVGLLAGLPAGQVEAILLHELAHIRRYDYLANLLQHLVEGLLFYHPAVWWISSAIRAERENCCDDVVVAVRGGAYEYANALAALEQNRGPRQALAATGGSLVKRIRRLLAQPEQPSAALTPVLTAAILMATVITAMAWQSKPAGPLPVDSALPSEKSAIAADPALRPHVKQMAQLKQGPNRAEVPRQEPVSPYRNWMNEDVAYILTDGELQTFQQLVTDQDRDGFIEQFWLRRDPTPGTVDNEFKEEHYRRIAYANDRFGTSISGWKTDRGRIYILYGPPDEIESHSSGGAYRRPAEQGGGTTATFPFEQWRYRWIEGVGNNIIMEFVDTTRTGEYRMTTDPLEKDAQRFVMGAAPEARTPGKAPVSVQVMGNSAALISLPIASYGDHRIGIFGRVTSSTGRVDTFEDTVQGPAPLYTRFVAVRPGAYRLQLTVKDITTGAVLSSDIGFDVK